MKTDSKTITVIDLAGHFDKALNRAVRYSCRYPDGKLWCEPECVEQPVCFGPLEKYSLKKNRGKRNSVTRPLVYTWTTPNDGKARDNWRNKTDPVRDILNKSVDLSCSVIIPGTEYEDKLVKHECGDITLSPDKISEVSKILRDNGFSEVYMKCQKTDYDSSFTPEELDTKFIKLA